jgi:ribosomal-protein-alanine N-acetyltransferase
MIEEYFQPDNKIKIVPATIRDLTSLHALEKKCFQVDAWPLLDLFGVLTFPQIIRLKAVDGDTMVGFIAVDLRRGQKTAWIATLAIDPAYRRIGLGSRLLEICESKVTLPKIRLCVRQSNQPAITLYLKYGYQQIDIWKSYYKGGDNALVFEKILSTLNH